MSSPHEIPPALPTLEEWVRAQAQARGMSLRALAAGAGISPQSLYQLMDRPVRGGESSERLAAYLGVAPAAIRAMAPRVEREAPERASTPVVGLITEALVRRGSAGAVGNALARELSCSKSAAYQLLRGGTPSASLAGALVRELGVDARELARALEPDLEPRWVGARLARGLSRGELAELSGSSVRTIGALERGERISPVSLAPIARVLGVDVGEEGAGESLLELVHAHQARTGVSLGELARECRVSRQGLSLILTGATREPRESILVALAMELGVELARVEELLSRARTEVCAGG